MSQSYRFSLPTVVVVAVGAETAVVVGPFPLLPLFCCFCLLPSVSVAFFGPLLLLLLLAPLRASGSPPVVPFSSLPRSLCSFLLLLLELLLLLLTLLLLLLPEEAAWEAAPAGGVPTVVAAAGGLPPEPPPFSGDFLSAPVPSASEGTVGVDSLRLSSLIVSVPVSGSSEATGPLLSCSGFRGLGDVRSSATGATDAAAGDPVVRSDGGPLPLIRLELSSGWCCWEEGADTGGTDIPGLVSACCGGGGGAAADCGESCCR